MFKEKTTEKFVIKKALPLSGEVRISGSKNAALPILAATLLTEDTVVLENVPQLSDIEDMLTLLRGFGARVERGENALFVNCAHIKNQVPDISATKKIRASFLLAGALLGRFGECSLQMPGGCGITSTAARC